MNTAPTTKTTARYCQLRFRGKAAYSSHLHYRTTLYRFGRRSLLVAAGLMPMPRKAGK